jgi:uncharacterized glyoxalase superfamily protein PhnB
MSNPSTSEDRRKRSKPESLRCRRMSAGLTVADLQASLAWYRDVVGFTVEETWERDGAVAGAELVAGSVRILLNQDDWAKGRDRVKGQGIGLYLDTTQSVDTLAAGIKQRGGELASEPADMPWGARSFAVVDPDGFRWTVSSARE